MRRLIAIASILMLAACGGPEVPLEIVGKSVPVNVAFGPNGALPPVEVRPEPDGFVVVPPAVPPEALPPIRVPPPPLPPRPCPKAHPFAFPKKATTDSIFEPPAGAQYRFRYAGERTVGDRTTVFAPQGVRTVGNIGTTPIGDMRYDVSEVLGAEITITSYQVTSRALELTGIQRIVNGQRTTFAPTTPIMLMQMPPRQTDPLGRRVISWNSAGTDPVSQTTMVVQGQLIADGKARVNACGELVDSWLAELSVRTVKPTEDTTATWRINVATQYGGLLVQEVLTVTGTRDGAPYEEKRRATISEVPK